MVQTKAFLVTFPLSFVAASEAHGPFTYPWDRTATSELTTEPPIETSPVKSAPKTSSLFGGHQAYLKHELTILKPTTFLTVTKTTRPTTTPTLAAPTITATQEHSRRQLGGVLGGLLGGVGGVVSTLLGGLQPAVASALAPIQSAANTNLAQVSLIQSLAPNVVPMADVVGPAASAVNPVLGNLLGGILSAIGPVVSGIGGAVASPIGGLAVPIESAVAAPLQAAVATLVSALAPAVAAALDPVGSAVGGLVQPVAADLLGPIESAVAPLLGGVVSAAVGVVGGIEGPAADALRPVLNGIDSAVLPLASSVVAAVWPAIAPIVTPLNPVICALQPAEVPIGTDVTALIPVQCVSVSSGNVIPISTGMATVISPSGILSITSATLAPALSINGPPDKAAGALPIPGIPVLPIATPTTTITAPNPSNVLGSAVTLGSNPFATTAGDAASNVIGTGVAAVSNVLSSAAVAASNTANSVAAAASIAGISSPTGTGTNATGSGANSVSAVLGTAAGVTASFESGSSPSAVASNPFGAAAAAASSLLAVLGTASNRFGVSLSAPSFSSSQASSIPSPIAPFGLASVIAGGPSPAAAPSIIPAGVGSPNVARVNVFTFTGAVTSVLTALPVVVPASVQVGNMGTWTSGPASQSCTMMQPGTLSTAPPVGLPNIPFPAPNPPAPMTPLPVSSAVPAANFPPLGGTVPTPSPVITAGPLAAQGGLMMLAYGSQTITFAASQLPGGAMVASIGGSMYAFPASAPAPVASKRRRDLSTQPDYKALALALVSLIAAIPNDSGQATVYSAPEAVNGKALPVSSGMFALPPSISSGSLTTSSPVASSTSSAWTSVSSASDTSASGDSVGVSTCSDINGTSYLSNGGSVYQIVCGTNWVGRDIQPWRSTADFDACVAQCDALNAAARTRPCAGTLFVPDAPASAANCYPKYSVDNPTNATGGYTFQAAVLQSSGNVVDNGVGAPVGHAQAVDVLEKDETNLNNWTTNAVSITSIAVKSLSSAVRSSGTLAATASISTRDLGIGTGMETATPSIQTLDLTSLTTLGGLNMSNETNSGNIVGLNLNGMRIVYATGTKVIEPVLSTTIVLGAASNEPARQYFALSSTASASGLAKRNWLPDDPSPDNWLPLPTAATGMKRGSWLPGAPSIGGPNPGPTIAAQIQGTEQLPPGSLKRDVRSRPVTAPVRRGFWLPGDPLPPSAIFSAGVSLHSAGNQVERAGWLPANPLPPSAITGSEFILQTTAVHVRRGFWLPGDSLPPSNAPGPTAVAQAQGAGWLPLPPAGTGTTSASQGLASPILAAAGPIKRQESDIKGIWKGYHGPPYENTAHGREPPKNYWRSRQVVNQLNGNDGHKRKAFPPWSHTDPDRWGPKDKFTQHADSQSLSASTIVPRTVNSVSVSASTSVEHALPCASIPIDNKVEGCLGLPKNERAHAEDVQVNSRQRKAERIMHFPEPTTFVTSYSLLPWVVPSSSDRPDSSLHSSSGSEFSTSVPIQQFAGWLPTTPDITDPTADKAGWLPKPPGAEIYTEHWQTPSALSVRRRDVDNLLDNPNDYHDPISDETGANFALAANPVDSATGNLQSNSSTEPNVAYLTNIPHFSRDGGKGGVIGNHHVFTFADTGVYTTQEDGSNGHFIGYASSSVAMDITQHGLFGNALTIQDGIGEFASAQGSLRGFAPFTTGETGFNDQAMAAGISSRYAIWPESSLIPLTANVSIMFAPLVYDVVDNVTKSADFTYTGNTLLMVSVDDVAGPIAERPVGRMFNATDVEWGCVGGIRSWGSSGVGGDDGYVYLFGNVPGGLLMARTNVTTISDTNSYEYWGGSAWTVGSLAPDSTAYVLEGSFMDVDVFYSPRHLTFIAVYTNIYGDNTAYWRYLDAPQGLLPGFAGGDPDSDIVEALTKYKWSDEQVLFKLGAGLNGDYSYAVGAHLGYFGGNDIVNGGEKMLLSWTSPTGQDPASRNSAFQIMSGIVTWE